MRVLQIIDSLEAGGAERMAVNYANALAKEIEFSGLVVTRKEGALLNQVNKDISYLYLNKTHTIDLKSIYKLRKFVIDNKVEVVHAHSTSFFTAFLLKLIYPSIKLIWHDHYGDSEFLSKRPLLSLRMVIPFFNGIIAVNQQLKIWAEQKIHLKNVIYLPNFPSEENAISEQTILQGIKGKRIVSLANLRVQKNHFLLLEVARKVKISHPEWTFHLVGKDFEDDYSKKIKTLILDYNLENNVFIYGSRQDIKNTLNQSTIGILTSQSEGLPVALLEYGLQKKAVVVTNVGEVPLLIQDGINGFIVNATESQLFYELLVKLLDNKTLRSDFGKALQKTINNNYSEVTVIKQYLDWLDNF
ncbi:glycosyltransferase [Flavobacterium soyangense]|uniref:Glycosyltransferase n=1 Tax=Flavobacterium soyangense TaxID=2023265 RepID=A0A930XYX7_9FLAO|nr:glycosyltransferase [Flavobacterium soyangense]MBF2708303.1 glycosyltransferase [Flavobacterium soyangense]